MSQHGVVHIILNWLPGYICKVPSEGALVSVRLLIFLIIYDVNGTMKEMKEK